MSKPLVTLGFRCTHSMKEYLNNSAKGKNMTLSQYVNELVSEAEMQLVGLTRKLVKKNDEIRLLKSLIDNYESSTLKQLFEKYKGETAFVNELYGNRKTITINTILDLHEVIIKSFK